MACWSCVSSSSWGRTPQYGYELLTVLARWPQLAVSEGTLYPLLRRLEKEEVISAQWRESVAGPPRKYYALTAAGAQRRDALAAEWSQLMQAMTELQSYVPGGTRTLKARRSFLVAGLQVGAATA